MRMVAKLSSHGVKMTLAPLFPKAKPKTQKLSLIKPVVLGKKPFADAILTVENKQRFNTGKTQQLTRPPLPAKQLTAMFKYQTALAKQR